VFASAFRVLKPGGRFGISDVAASDQLTAQHWAERGEWVGCIAGALSVSEYRQQLTTAGFTGIDISLTQRLLTACTRRSSVPPKPPKQITVVRGQRLHPPPHNRPGR
jgi:hypothetical protein